MWWKYNHRWRPLPRRYRLNINRLCLFILGFLIINFFTYYLGGLGEAVLSAVAEEKSISVKKLAVTDIPRSGPPNVLLDLFGISAKNIVAAVKKIVT